MRTTAKKHDVCFLVRVWGGADGLEGVEHNLRIAEAVASLGHRALVHAYVVQGDLDVQIQRLESCRRRMEQADDAAGNVLAYCGWFAPLCDSLGHARLYFRGDLTGALALGACTVLDRKPLTRWPVPLRAGVHFLDLGLDLPRAQRVARRCHVREHPLRNWTAGYDRTD
jgi:hypothetical protein